MEASTCALALTSGCGSSGSTGNEGQCKEGRVWYQGKCCPDDNANYICDWVDDGTVVGQDAYSADAGVAADSEDTSQKEEITSCNKKDWCLEYYPRGSHCISESEIAQCLSPCDPKVLEQCPGDKDCYVTETIACPNGTSCYEGDCS